MAAMNTPFEQQILQNVRLLSAEQQQEVLDFAAFLLSKVRASRPHDEQTDVTDVVERTWGSIPLDRKTAIYVAEDKELEYDV